MRGKDRNPIEARGKLPQFTTMHVIEGQAGQINYTSLIFYSLTFNNILNIIVMLILVAVTITMAVNGGLFGHAQNASLKTNEAVALEQEFATATEGMTTQQLIDKYTGTVSAASIVGNESLYYGKKINNYTLPATNTENITWRIFHSDGENIYLIASDYVQNAPGISGTAYKKSFSEVYNNYAVDTEGKKWIEDTNPAKKWLYNETTGEYEYINSTCNNMKAVAYMLDTEEWNTLYKDTQGFAEYAIGGPTIKLYSESYNAVHSSKITYRKLNCRLPTEGREW